MSWTKRQFIQKAFAKIGFGLDFNVTPEDAELALSELDSMMATWNARGIRLGYPLPSSPDDSDIDSDSGVPDSAYEAIYNNLALRIGPDYGKTPNPVVQVAAKQAYDTLLSRAVFPTPQPMPNTMPRGAGNKPWRTGYTFYPTPADVIEAGANDPLEFK